MNKILKFFISILICQLAGLVGSFFTTPAIATWYATLIKPSFNPPNWLFAPVWTTLFLFMGIALYLIWQKDLKDKAVKFAMWLFGIQLVFNILWSVLFFGLQQPLLAFIEIIVLWILILLTIIKFYKLDKVAGILLIPYILWVSFAAVLNFSLWQLNL